jgi:predicted CXXCH cytochrome family protein
MKATGIIGAICSLTAVSASASIVGSKHDLRGYLGLGSEAEICIVCHTPHDANGNEPGGAAVDEAPLWNHKVTTATFTMYGTNGTLQAAEDPTPTGPSKLCLSCHDGTVAVDDYGGGLNNAGPISNQETYYLGTDLRGKHPISITYDSAADPMLNDPSNPVTVGGYDDGTGTLLPTRSGTLGSLMLTKGKVQCNSCHDVHNTFVAAPPLLRVNQSGSALCLTCHNI